MGAGMGGLGGMEAKKNVLGGRALGLVVGNGSVVGVGKEKLINKK